MGLDATVYCYCFERGLLRTEPPSGCRVLVDGNGSLCCESRDGELILAFDQWLQTKACEHEDGILVTHRLGNISLVAALREALSRWPERFPVILSRVIYNGVHGGDFIIASDVPTLIPEVEALAEIHCSEPDMEQFMRGFEAQMKELVSASLKVGKPIAF